MIVTKNLIIYNTAPYGRVGVIPAGTECIPVQNQPGKTQYWVLPWPGMTETEQSWQINYGYLLTAEEVTFKFDEEGVPA